MLRSYEFDDFGTGYALEDKPTFASEVVTLGARKIRNATQTVVESIAEIGVVGAALAIQGVLNAEKVLRGRQVDQNEPVSDFDHRQATGCDVQLRGSGHWDLRPDFKTIGRDLDSLGFAAGRQIRRAMHHANDKAVDILVKQFDDLMGQV